MKKSKTWLIRQWINRIYCPTHGMYCPENRVVNRLGRYPCCCASHHWKIWRLWNWRKLKIAE